MLIISIKETIFHSPLFVYYFHPAIYQPPCFIPPFGAEIIRIGRVSSSCENFLFAAKALTYRALK